MASLVDILEKLVGFKRREESNGEADKKDRIGEFQTLSKQFVACKDEALRAQLWEQLCKVMPDTLFLAPMCFSGEDPNVQVNDRELHATIGAKRLYARNQNIVTNGNPGYRLAKAADNRRIHLRTIVYHQTKEEWVPLFTDFTQLLPIFGKTSRVTVISFAEARQMAKPYKGIVINPGPNAIRLNNGETKKAQ